MDPWLFIAFCLYLFYYSTCSSFGCWKLLEVGFFWHAPILFWALPYFLALRDAPGSPDIFSAPPLKSIMSTRNSGFFYWEMAWRTKIWALGMFIITGTSLILNFISAFIDILLSWLMWFLYWVLQLCSVSVPTLFLFRISLAILVPFPLHVKIYKTTCWDFHWVCIDRFEVNWHLNNIKSSTSLLFFFFFTILISIQHSSQCMETYLR